MTASLFLFIVLIALLNLGLGYSMALYQGHGPTFDLWALIMPRWRLVRVGAATAPSPPEVAGLPVPVAGVAAAEPPPTDEVAVDPSEPDESDAYQQAVSKSRDDAQRHCEQLTKLNQHVRDVEANPDRAQLEKCTGDLKDLNQEYLDRQQANMQQAAENLPADDDHDTVDDKVRDACESHTSEIRDSLDAVDGSILSEDNLEDYCRQLLEETDRQIESSGEYRDTVDEALGGSEEQSGDQPSQHDPERPAVVTTVEAAVAKILHRWREDPEQKDKSLTAALIDVDDYAQLVNRHGSLTGNRVVAAIKDTVVTAQQEGGELSHNSGQLFVLDYPATPAQWVGASLERIRQIVEKTQFQHEGAVIPVTISTAAAEATADDTSESLCQRLLATVREAQDSGKNRTYLHQGTSPSPMQPPQLDIGENTVDV